jgi:hypothetical protein
LTAQELSFIPDSFQIACFRILHSKIMLKNNKINNFEAKLKSLSVGHFYFIKDFYFYNDKSYQMFYNNTFIEEKINWNLFLNNKPKEMYNRLQKQLTTKKTIEKKIKI